MARRLSLVIVARSRAAGLLENVGHALALSERPPVIVVDSASEAGGSGALKERFPQVKLVRLPFDMGVAARNLGVERAETPYVAFSDDDTSWSAGSLGLAADLLDFYPRVAVLTARILVGGQGREHPATAGMTSRGFAARGLPGAAVHGFVDGACVFRRRAFLEAGGYEPCLAQGGENALARELAAAGWQMVYSPRLTVHYGPAGVREVCFGDDRALRLPRSGRHP